MKKSPLAQVKEKFGSKDKLVEEILSAIAKNSGKPKEDLKKTLSAQSNQKLMTLLKRERAIQEKFGSRDKLVDALVKSRMGKEQKEDKEYRKAIAALSSGRLLDLARRHKLAKGL